MVPYRVMISPGTLLPPFVAPSYALLETALAYRTKLSTCISAVIMQISCQLRLLRFQITLSYRLVEAWWSIYHWSVSSLVEIKVYHQADTKALPQLLLTYWDLKIKHQINLYQNKKKISKKIIHEIQHDKTYSVKKNMKCCTCVRPWI